MLHLAPVFVTIFFLGLSLGSTLFVNSSFLGKFFPQDIITLLFFLGPALNITLLFFSTTLVETFTRARLLLIFILTLFVSALCLFVTTNAWAIALAFVIYQGVIYTTLWCLDLFVQEGGQSKYTGELRGIYLTLLSAGIALGPLLTTLLGLSDNLQPIYLVSALLLLIPFVIALELTVKNGHRIVPPHLTHHPLHQLPFRRWWQSKDLRAVSLVNLALNTFFGAMIIYTPIYLNGTLGMPWGELGLIFTAMLIPFVVIDWPAGELGDRFWGEKEMLVVGVLITGASLLIMPFIGGSFWEWLLILVMSRVGAALTEVCADGYFFKKIPPHEISLISIFRLIKPVGMILGALLGLLISSFYPIPIIFFALAVIMFLAVREALSIVDTR